jgi:hypothetical protein
MKSFKYFFESKAFKVSPERVEDNIIDISHVKERKRFAPPTKKFKNKTKYSRSKVKNEV